MKLPPIIPRLWLQLTLALVVVGTASAQNLLIVEHHGKGAVVRAVRRTRPMVMEKDKLVTATGNRFGLKPVEEIYPIFVSVREFQVRTTSIQLMDSGNSINNQLELSGVFFSQTALKDVFLVLELDLEDGGKSILLQEVGQLSARKPRSIKLAFATGYNLGKGRYTFHLFSEGVEVMNSMQPFEYREHLLDKFIAKRAANRPDGPPEPFVCPAPEYPPALAKKKVAGRASVRIRIRKTGAVLDPVLTEASDPAFGEAAVAAVRQWRFIPAIKNGRPVEITATMPLEFQPEEPPAAHAE